VNLYVVNIEILQYSLIEIISAALLEHVTAFKRLQYGTHVWGGGAHTHQIFMHLQSTNKPHMKMSSAIKWLEPD